MLKMSQWLYLELAANSSRLVEGHNWQLRSEFEVLGHCNLINGLEADLSANLVNSKSFWRKHL